MDVRKNIILIKSEDFSVNVIFFVQKNAIESVSQVLGKKFLRSSTSIGANFCEAQDSSSSKEFTQKMLIALREAKESQYWIRLLKRTNSKSMKDLLALESELGEVTALLVAIIKKMRNR